MKQPWHGIPSTTPKEIAVPKAQNNPTMPNLLVEDSNETITNVFYFGAFADKNSGI